MKIIIKYIYLFSLLEIIIFQKIPLIAHPLKERNKIFACKIKNFKIIEKHIGINTLPGSLYFSFTLLNNENTFLLFFNKRNFKIFIGEKKVNNFILQSLPDKYKIFIPQLPYQDKNKKYDLTLKVIQNQTTNLIYKKSKIIQYKRNFTSSSINLILIVDTSASMFQNDLKNFRHSAIKNIIEYAKLNNCIKKLAIIKFSSIAQIVLPLTYVYKLKNIKNILAKIDSNGETNISDALRKAYNLVLKEKNKKQTVIILLTDGYNTSIYKNEHLKFKKFKIPIYTIGLKENVDNKLLNKIATDTSGKYFKIPESFEIQKIYFKIVNEKINKKILFSRDIDVDPYKITKFAYKNNKNLAKLNILIQGEIQKITFDLYPKQKFYNFFKSKKFLSFDIRNLTFKKYIFNFKNSSKKRTKITLMGTIDEKLIIKNLPIKKMYYLNEPVELSILLFQDNLPIKNAKINAKIFS